MRVTRFSDEVETMLAGAGFEPCFVRDLYDGDVIAIRRGTDDETPTEMTVTELFLPGAVVRTGYGDAQWIGVLATDGRKIHCTYEGKHPAWRQPRTQEDGEQPGAVPVPFWEAS
ncbi:hypothetical protein ACFPJ1_40825 [Kribbella qitaiheensis]|uniref:hypothetical protein n=1 Tax=Kribbella qitaiheensis TaxID=1544730 RepID=UPI00361EB2FB